jgi:hypothetical protein
MNIYCFLIQESEQNLIRFQLFKYLLIFVIIINVFDNRLNLQNTKWQ